MDSSSPHPQGSSPLELPTGAVVVATRNRAHELPAMLKSLEVALEQAPNTEIWLVDNGSTDDTPKILCSWAERRGFVHVLTVPDPGKSRALNAAIERVRADVVLFADDDVVIDPMWIVATVRFFATHTEVAATAGRVLPLLPEGASALFSCTELPVLRLVLPLYDHGNEPLEREDMYGANMAVRTVVLRRLGGFNVTLGPGAAGLYEDLELARRLRAAGYRVFYNPDAVVYHQVLQERLTRAYLWQRGRVLGVSAQLAGCGHSRVRNCLFLAEIGASWLWATLSRQRHKQLRSEFRLARHWGELQASLRNAASRQ